MSMFASRASSLERKRQNADRRAFIGGSDAQIIMGNDEPALIRLWQEKRGEVQPEDLSGDLLVQLGTVTEQLNRHWYEKNTGHAYRHPAAEWTR
jgi:predicted phage-related endonuclease